MSPRDAELDDDFVISIILCTFWKAPRSSPQTASLAYFAQMQSLAKLNVSRRVTTFCCMLMASNLNIKNSTTYFLYGIVSRAARVNRLDLAPNALLDGDTSSENIARVRLWLSVCFVDAQACMQNGRAASLDITDRYSRNLYYLRERIGNPDTACTLQSKSHT